MGPDSLARNDDEFYRIWNTGKGSELSYASVKKISVTDPDPVSGAFLTPGSGSGIGFCLIPDPQPQFFGATTISTIIFIHKLKFFLFLFKHFFYFVKFVVTKKGKITKFFPFSFVVAIGIRIRDG
jgi:hypothetical protein